MTNHFAAFVKRINSPFFFRLFLLLKLPAAFFAGLKFDTLNETKAIVSVKEKWLNKNPFNSIYFAVLAMAAELSTGILCMGNMYKRKPGISMLVVEQKGMFYKKAKNKILFVCEDGSKISNAVEEAVSTSNAVTIVCYSKGINNMQEVVAEFWITWSFKKRSH